MASRRPNHKLVNLTEMFLMKTVIHGLFLFQSEFEANQNGSPLTSPTPALGEVHV